MDCLVSIGSYSVYSDCEESMKKLPYQIDERFLNIKVTQSGDKRFYSSEGNGFTPVPSVTTMIGVAYWSPALERWIKNNRELGAKIRADGNKLHSFAENKVLGKKPKAETPNQAAMDKLLEKRLDAVYDVELGIAGKYFGGRIDLLGVWGGINSLIDFKTTQKTKELYQIEKYFVQGILYCMLLNEAGMNPMPEQIVIALVEPNGTIDVHTCSAKDPKYLKKAWTVVQGFGIGLSK